MNINLLYNFFLGENSPLFAARIDSQAHEMGAKRTENFIPMLTGGLRKRPGTWFDGNTNDNNEARLIEWLLSDGNCVILEVTEGVIQVWSDQGNNTYRIIQTITSPYTVEQLHDLHYAASSDEMWLVHSEHRPISLIYEKIEDAEQKRINMYYREFKKTGYVDEKTGEVTDKIDFKSENNRPSCVAFDSGRLCFAGTNNNPNRIYLSRAPDSKIGKNRCTDFTTEDVYITVRETVTIALNEDGSEKTEEVKDEDGNTVYGPDKLVFEIIYDDATNICKINLKGRLYNISVQLDVYDPLRGGTISILGDVVFANHTSPTVGQFYYSLNNRDGCAVSGATGVADGLNGYYTNPANTYLSRIQGEWYQKGDALTKPIYETHTEVTENINITASHAIILEENDMHGSRLQWIAGSRHLLAATERATWSDTGDIPTPATFDMNIIEYAGANNLQARGTKEIMVYAGRDGKSLRALVWNQNQQESGYIDIDISEQAAHLFTEGIKDFAIADYPYPMIWIVTKPGELISCTINIRSGILAYAKHPTDGIVEAVSVAPQKTGDVIFLVVNRDGNRNIEHIILDDLINSDYSDSHYIDAGEIRIFDTPTKTIRGLQRFAGKTVRAFADGAIEPPIKVDEDGKAELQTEVTKIHIGLPYKSSFSPNDRQIPANGTSLGKKRRIEKIILKLYKSFGGGAGTDENKITAIITSRFGEYKLGTPPEPFTGEYDITVSGNIDTEGKLFITHEEPCPFTLLAITERVAILEV